MEQWVQAETDLPVARMAEIYGVSRGTLILTGKTLGFSLAKLEILIRQQHFPGTTAVSRGDFAAALSRRESRQQIDMFRQRRAEAIAPIAELEAAADRSV